jgi:hypothetical protein
MSITVEWDDQSHLAVRWTFDGPWTWDDFRIAQTESIALMETVEHTVDVIGDLRRATLVPKDAFRNFRYLKETVSASNRGRIVAIAESLLVKLMLSTYNQLFKHNGDEIILVDTLDAAREILSREPA